MSVQILVPKSRIEPSWPNTRVLDFLFPAQTPPSAVAADGGFFGEELVAVCACISNSHSSGLPEGSPLSAFQARFSLPDLGGRGHDGWPFARHELDSKGTGTTAPTNVPLAVLGNLQVPKAMIQ